MEKRTIIAVGLSFAVLMLWQILVLGPQEKAYRARIAAARDSLAQSGAAAGAGVAASPGEKAPAGAAPAGTEIGAAPSAEGGPTASGHPSNAVLPRESEAPETPVVVETDLFRARLSTRGARITSLSLGKFASHRGGVVDLVPETGPGAFGLTLHLLEGETKRDLPLDEFVFTVDAAQTRVAAGEEGAVVFRGEPLPGLHVTKRMIVRGGSYDWKLEVAIERDEGAPAVYSYTVDLGNGLALTEANHQEDHRYMAASLREQAKLHLRRLAAMKPGEVLAWSGNVQWVALTSKYFVIGLAAEGNPPLEVAMPRTANGEGIGLALTLPHTDDASARSGHHVIDVYSGPLDARLVETSPLHMTEVIDYGWRPFQPISQFLLWCLNGLHRLIPNYGIAIILISTAMKAAFFKLSHQSYKSMRDMQKIQGELQVLRDKYNNDAKKLNEETMALYKKHGVNPLGGCLPLLLQTPVFIALYNVLRRTIALRQAPFVLWIHDLSAPDELVHFPVTLPFLGSAFSLLPILLGLATFFQQKMTSADPRQKTLLYIMPVFMTFIFYHFPAGLNLYWLTNTALTVTQQSLIERKERAREAAAAAATAEVVELPTRAARSRGDGRWRARD